MNVDKVAKLANLPITKKQEEELGKQLQETVAYVSKLQELSTEGAVETSQVTGAENVYRQDQIDTARMLTQEEALKNAKHTQDGYFVVDAIFTQ